MRLTARLAVACALAALAAAAAFLPRAREALSAEAARPVVERAPLPEFTLSPDDRVLILSPHPDDETLACGGVIQKAIAAKIPCKVVFLTNGDDNELSFLVYKKHPVILGGAAVGMGIVRQNEAVTACGILGLSKDDLTFLGYPDFGTAKIWLFHWGASKPYRSILTRATSVPYKNAFRVGATYKGDDLLADLKKIIRDFRPTKIFLSHPADRNGDHWALHLFTRVALWDLRDEIKPELYPFIVHYGKWPYERGLHPEMGLEPPTELVGGTPWKAVRLSSSEEDVKLNAVQAHRSQYGYSRGFMTSFVRANELFGLPPDRPIPESASVEVAGPAPAGDGAEGASIEKPAAFVAVGHRYATIEGGKLVLSAELSKSLGRDVEVSVFAFGWRRDKAFAEMPKLHVRIGPFGHSVYDQQKKLPADTVEVKKELLFITVRVPLAALGDPGKVISNARTYLGETPLDSGQWIFLDLPAQGIDSTATRAESIPPAQSGTPR